MTEPGRPVTVAVVGAGDRGSTYTAWVHAHPDRARLVAVAEPSVSRRHRLVAGAAGVREYADWRDMVAEGRVADMVIIATLDSEHLEPARAFSDAGYHILLEKPMAPTAEECRQLVDHVAQRDVLFGVCHVLRYTPYSDVLTGVLGSGVLGQLLSVDHVEPVGWWHMAHSYVRGKWRREDESGPMLLTKSCHDLDWLRYVVGRPITRVASFGSLGHFRPEQAPPGAADRCLECPLVDTCPYSAPRIYLDALRTNGPVWPVSVVTDATDEAGVLEALRTGPYGACVYRGGNDVVDHQVVSLAFEGGVTGSFTMIGPSEPGHRRTRIWGSHGSLEGDGTTVRVVDFRTGEQTVHVVDESGWNAADGHGGGDSGVIAAFVHAVATNDPSSVRSGAAESLETHLAVFAAEEARRTGRVVRIDLSAPAPGESMPGHAPAGADEGATAAQ